MCRYRISFLKNERNGDSRLTTAWNCMIHLVTTLVVLTQNCIPLRRFSSVVNVINLVSLMSNLENQARVFARSERILQKEASFCPAKRCLRLKYIFIKVLLICSQRCSLKYINLYFHQSQSNYSGPRLNQTERIRRMHFFSYQFPFIIKILSSSQMYVVTGVEFIFPTSLSISSVKI